MSDFTFGQITGGVIGAAAMVVIYLLPTGMLMGVVLATVLAAMAYIWSHHKCH